MGVRRERVIERCAAKTSILVQAVADPACSPIIRPHEDLPACRVKGTESPRKMALQQFMAASLGASPNGELWVFGYGSLMWSPGFPLAASSPALLHGYHRALCIYSHRHRGTPSKPGLVLGLRRGGSCWGMAFHVRAPHARDALTALWKREMRNYAYTPRLVPISLRSTTAAASAKSDRLIDSDAAVCRVRALTFVADSAHRQYVRELSLEQTARLVARGRGERGHNIEYLDQTLTHMHALGIRDHHLQHTLERARILLAGRRRSR